MSTERLKHADKNFSLETCEAALYNIHATVERLFTMFMSYLHLLYLNHCTLTCTKSIVLLRFHDNHPVVSTVQSQWSPHDVIPNITSTPFPRRISLPITTTHTPQPQANNRTRTEQAQKNTEQAHHIPKDDAKQTHPTPLFVHHGQLGRGKELRRPLHMPCLRPPPPPLPLVRIPPLRLPPLRVLPPHALRTVPDLRRPHFS